MGTKLNPGEFDCRARALPGEPLFTFLAREKFAPACIRAWVAERRAEIDGLHRPTTDLPMLMEAEQCAAEMEAWHAVRDSEWMVYAGRPTSDTDRFDRALPDEPLFTFLGRDKNAPRRLRYWAATLSLDISVMDFSDSTAQNRFYLQFRDSNDAIRIATEMEQWRIAHYGEWWTTA